MYFQAEHDCISPEADVLNDVYREECSLTLKSLIPVSVRKGRKINQVSTPQTLTCYWCVCGVHYLTLTVALVCTASTAS